MRVLRRLMIFLLAPLEALRDRLRTAEDAAEVLAARKVAGGFSDGQWIKVVSVGCPCCHKDFPLGSVHRIKRFEMNRGGEWVVDRPETAFLLMDKDTKVVAATAAEAMGGDAAWAERMAKLGAPS